MDVVIIVMGALGCCGPCILINTGFVVLIAVVDVLLFLPIQVYHYRRYR